MVMGGTCKCTPRRAPGPRHHWRGRYAGCSPRTAACRLLSVCGERSAERTEPHPGDADLGPWMPRPA